MNRKWLWLFCAITFTVVHPAAAQNTYPDKPIRFIVGYPPGGGTDFMARAISERLGQELDTTIIIDNRGGASGIIGTALAAKAPPDGYTLLLATGTTFAVNPHTKKNLPYDSIRDFVPISLVANQPYMLVVNPAVAAQSVRELIDLAKAKPRVLNHGSSGSGSSGHLAGAMLNYFAGVDIVHIPYKGNGPAIIDLISGQVSLMFSTIPAVVPHVKSGRLRGLATTGIKRSLAVPHLPTMIESGLAEFRTGTWYGAVAPATTSPKVITTLNKAVLKALAHPSVGERVASEGAEVVGSSSAEFAKFIRDEIVRYGKVVAIAGLKPE